MGETSWIYNVVFAPQPTKVWFEKITPPTRYIQHLGNTSINCQKQLYLGNISHLWVHYIMHSGKYFLVPPVVGQRPIVPQC